MKTARNPTAKEFESSCVAKCCDNGEIRFYAVDCWGVSRFTDDGKVRPIGTFPDAPSALAAYRENIQSRVSEFP